MLLRAAKKEKEEKLFLITFSGGVSLSTKAVWPDGDAPKNPTDADVAATMRGYGTKWHTLHEWNLTDDVQVSVGDEIVWPE